MRRDQLEHAVRAAAQLLGLDSVVVIGSQSILGTWSEDMLPSETHGFHIDGADTTTAVLPQGWQERLVPVKSWSAGTSKEYTGLCLGPLDAPFGWLLDR